MKFLLTTHQFFPDFSAGTEVLTRSVARELRSRGHEVRILTGCPSAHPPDGDARFDEYANEGIHVYRFHHSYTPADANESSVALGYDNDIAADYFSRIVQAYQPDLVHFFHLNRLGTGLIDRAVGAGIPAFMSPTDFWAICPSATLMLANGQICAGPSAYAGNCVKHFASASTATRNSLASKVVQMLPVPVLDGLVNFTVSHRFPRYPQSQEVRAMAGRLAKNVARLNQLQKIVVPTDVMRSVLEQYGISPQRIAKMAYGTDATAPVMRNYATRSAEKMHIGFIGTLVAHKGAHVLLDAIKLLPQDVANVAIYGNFNDYPEYANRLANSTQGMGHVEFRGVFPNAEIAQVLAGLDVLVVPSLWHENTPLVIHSALAAGCPVVASNALGISEVVIHRHNGLLFELGNVQSLAAQLSALIDEPGLLQALSDQCKPLQSTAGYVDAMMEYWTGAAHQTVTPC
jgi:glycosyltransferase involved in cell wall biosynthesis